MVWTKYLKDGKDFYYLCSGSRTKCKEKFLRGDGRELVYINRWRLANILMTNNMEYIRKKIMEDIINFVDGWTPRGPEPIGVPSTKEKPELLDDPIGLDKALEEAKKAATEKGETEEKKGEAKVEAGRGRKGSVEALLERKAAERRE